ncbi:hypothetical protein [Halococcus sp. PRR34]|uniref:hypothetical protein n=1 Tax=Halococcus sp. PRR34 TaxID=3020830 RepID=UPI002361885B|nr:hypothetical protein [Halococcus sp. PRR34]
MKRTDQDRNAQAVTDGGKPVAPAIIPEYVREGVERQDTTILRQIATWCEQLADYRDERPIEVDDDEELVEVNEDGGDGGDDGSGGTQVIKKIPCGKDCNGCPHGPYEYRVKRQGKNLKWEYIGRVDS